PVFRSENREIRQDFCVYLQIIPGFASCFSSMLLLNLALDRLLSLTTSYKVLANFHTRLYITIQLLPACVFAAVIVILAFLNRNADEYVICTGASYIHYPVIEIYVNTVTIICILLIICYSLFGILLKRLPMSTENMRNVYRSLIVINTSIVFGNFGAIILALTDEDHRNPTLSTVLLAGLLMSFGSAMSFFAYYLMR
ncbi:hypothetical protein GCK32_018293, partial [Trichostrongylus colubriformis]